MSHRPKILFVSHAADHTGAPLSLLGLISFFKRKYDWDIRILVRKDGPLIDHFRKISPTEIFFKYPSVITKGTGASTRESNHKKRILKAIKHFSPSLAFSEYNLFITNLFPPNHVFDNLKTIKHIRKLRCKYAAWNPDIVYSNTATNGDCLHQLNLSAPIIVHVRELAFTLSRLAGIRLHAFKGKSDFIFSVSMAVQKYLRKNYNFPKDRMSIAPPGIDCSLIKEKAQEIPEEQIRLELGVSPKDIIVGGVGTAYYRKGFDIFIKVAEKVLKQFPNDEHIKFVWIGERLERRAIEEFIIHTGLSNRVDFIGVRENPFPYMNQFKFLIMPSRDDPFPRVNLEMAALGKPIIAFSQSGGSVEFIESDCGFHVEDFSVEKMAEKAINLLQDDRLCSTLGRNAQKKVFKKYDISQVATAIAEKIQVWFPNLEILNDR